MSLMIGQIATAVPVPQILSTFMYLSDYAVGTSVPSTVASKTVNNGDTVFSTKFNPNAAYLDVLAQYGGGVIGLIHGLLISDGGGLVLDISGGGALIGGAVQSKSASTLTLTDNSNNFIWFKQNGTFEAKTTTAAPSIPAVYIGMATTASGVITVLDGSGICYYRGLLYRETNDPGAPGDSPPNVVLLTKTLGGYYLWNGAEWDKLSKDTRTVEAVTATRSDTATHRNKITTNTGATSKPVITLEPAATGIQRTFYIDDTDGIRVQANTGDTIRVGANVSASAGYAESTTVGNTLCLVAINATEWIALYSTGTWTVV